MINDHIIIFLKGDNLHGQRAPRPASRGDFPHTRGAAVLILLLAPQGALYDIARVLRHLS